MPISFSQQIQDYPRRQLRFLSDREPRQPDRLRRRFPAHPDRARPRAGPARRHPQQRVELRRCEPGTPATPDEKHVCYPAGFQPGRLYELIYRAKDPMVRGLGFAATARPRRLPAQSPTGRCRRAEPGLSPGQCGDHRRHVAERPHDPELPGARLQSPTRAAAGCSTAPILISAAGLMPLNVRFGQPVRAWGEQTDHLYPAYDFPFSYARQSDPLTGRTQGLLDRCTATDTCPRIFHVATALEMWEGRQSLGLTDPLGQCDVADPPNVRTFIMASTQHGAARAAAGDEGAFRQLPAAAQSRSAALDHAGAADRADRMGARRRGPAAERHAAHRRRHAGPGRPGAVSRDSRQ